jgi:hypothetical protein
MPTSDSIVSFLIRATLVICIAAPDLLLNISLIIYLYLLFMVSFVKVCKD